MMQVLGKCRAVLRSIPAGERVEAVDDIPSSRKMALEDIRAGDPVRKYGEEIGRAQTDIPRGSWVHTRNLQTGERWPRQSIPPEALSVRTARRA